MTMKVKGREIKVIEHDAAIKISRGPAVVCLIQDANDDSLYLSKDGEWITEPKMWDAHAPCELEAFLEQVRDREPEPRKTIDEKGRTFFVRDRERERGSSQDAPHVAPSKDKIRQNLKAAAEGIDAKIERLERAENVSQETMQMEFRSTSPVAPTGNDDIIALMLAEYDELIGIGPDGACDSRRTRPAGWYFHEPYSYPVQFDGVDKILLGAVWVRLCPEEVRKLRGPLVPAQTAGEREELAAYRQCYGCLACGHDHPKEAMCPPHEVRTTGIAWWKERIVALESQLAAERAELQRLRKYVDAISALKLLGDTTATLQDKAVTLEAENEKLRRELEQRGPGVTAQQEAGDDAQRT